MQAGVDAFEPTISEWVSRHCSRSTDITTVRFRRRQRRLLAADGQRICAALGDASPDTDDCWLQ